MAEDAELLRCAIVVVIYFVGTLFEMLTNIGGLRNCAAPMDIWIVMEFIFIIGIPVSQLRSTQKALFQLQIGLNSFLDPFLLFEGISAPVLFLGFDVRCGHLERLRLLHAALR